jgi:hypothetical protein
LFHRTTLQKKLHMHPRQRALVCRRIYRLNPRGHAHTFCCDPRLQLNTACNSTHLDSPQFRNCCDSTCATLCTSGKETPPECTSTQKQYKVELIIVHRSREARSSRRNSDTSYITTRLWPNEPRAQQRSDVAAM